MIWGVLPQIEESLPGCLKHRSVASTASPHGMAPMAEAQVRIPDLTKKRGGRKLSELVEQSLLARQ